MPRCAYTETFRRSYRSLTAAERESIKRAIQRLANNPRYPGLRVKKMQGRDEVWEARASRDLRITFFRQGENILLRRCGHHDQALR